MKRPFDKPPTTYPQQIALLKQRGMHIEDDAEALFYLEHLNYYRLTAYWLPFEADHATHQFKAGTSFASVLELYRFDRELRLLLLDAIERVEVSVRAHWAYALAHHHGAHAHLDDTLAVNRSNWQKNTADLEKEVRRADERFILHMADHYVETLPPVWAVCEVMSLGVLSRWYGNLKPMPTRKIIAAAYGLDEAVLGSWLHHLSQVRNVCAHHGRLYNRDFKRTPMRPKRKPANVASAFAPNRRLYNTLIILLYFMDTLAPNHTWRSRLIALLNRYAHTLPNMGFVGQWLHHPLWVEPTAPLLVEVGK